MILVSGQTNIDGIIIVISPVGGNAHEFERAYEDLKRFYDYGFNVIALIDGICASGGYMLACTCNKIYATQMSKIGYIDVFSTYYNFGHLRIKIGIKEITMKVGDHKGRFPTFSVPSEDDF